MAADINHVVLVGRLTRDAELKSIASGQAVCKFSIAVNRSKKNGEQWEDEPNFFDVVLWGRRGEALHQYLNKGKLIGVDGELRQDRWQQDGQNRSKVEIVANNIQLLGGGSGGGGGSSSGSSFGGGASGGGNNSQGSAQQQGQNWQSQGAPADDGFADDIPF
ncbi:MAG: single-stranded DNA-binding protein [Treponema sp.]|jgi:single-strand DNA-binding protein|nr:single-stranded DNA-binding protein [Treponema sp.]